MLNGRCRMHGGNARKGFAHPMTTHGRYSKDLPTRLVARYHEAQNDADLLALRDEVSLLDARLHDVLSRVDTGESGRAWLLLSETYEGFIGAANDPDKARVLLGRMGDLISSGVADSLAWSEVRALVQDRRRLVESERKRLVDMQQMISAERAMVLLAAVVDTVRRHVSDRDALAAISADLGKLAAGGTFGATAT